MHSQLYSQHRQLQRQERCNPQSVSHLQTCYMQDTGCVISSSHQLLCWVVFEHELQPVASPACTQTPAAYEPPATLSVHCTAIKFPPSSTQKFSDLLQVKLVSALYEGDAPYDATSCSWVVMQVSMAMGGDASFNGECSTHCTRSNTSSHGHAHPGSPRWWQVAVKDKFADCDVAACLAQRMEARCHQKEAHVHTNTGRDPAGGYPALPADTQDSCCEA
jgi:hypothetical protein